MNRFANITFVLPPGLAATVTRSKMNRNPFGTVTELDILTDEK